MTTLTIREIKDDILRRAQERQTSLGRGNYDVPLHYSPLPLATLLDLIGQLEYRRDFLDLAVPPRHTALGERIKRLLKKLLCTSLRWLMIRQVEFNTVALQHARAAAETAARADQNQAEIVAAVGALRLQVHALSQRLALMEQLQQNLFTAKADDQFPESPADKLPAYQVYLRYMQDQKPVLIVGCERGDFLKLVLSEGRTVHGVEADPVLAEDCKERELPVSCTSILTYFDQLAMNSLGAIYLSEACIRLPSPDLLRLLGQCWTRLDKGGVLIAESRNPRVLDRSGSELPIELLGFLMETQAFTILDGVFSRPSDPTAAEVALTSSQETFDQKRYRYYAVIGCK